MFNTSDIHSLGKLADFKKRQISGDKVFFVLNRHINPTNICVLSCSFCDFAKKKGDKDAYEMTVDEILNVLTMKCMKFIWWADIIQHGNLIII